MKMDKKYFEEEIIPILVLTIVVCISVVILAIIDIQTEDQIAEQKQKTVDKMLEEQFPEKDNSTFNKDNEVYSILVNDTVVGYAFIIEGNGYGGLLEILVALENTTLAEDDIILRGISIIYNLETPGLGSRITEDSFLEQFSGMNLNDVQFKSDGGKVDAITGATISSSAVVEAIQDEVGSKVKEILKANEGEV